VPRATRWLTNSCAHTGDALTLNEINHQRIDVQVALTVHSHGATKELHIDTGAFESTARENFSPLALIRSWHMYARTTSAPTAFGLHDTSMLGQYGTSLVDTITGRMVDRPVPSVTFSKRR
jgi:hypothetical protein